MKKISLSLIASFLLMFSLSGLFNTIIIADFVAENISAEMLRQQPNMLFIVAGYVLLSLIMSLLFSRVFTTQDYTLKNGILFGFFAGIFWLLPYSLVLHGVYNFPAIALCIDTSWALIEQGLGGIVIAVVHNKFRD